MRMPEYTPVYVVTGFLDSGKTSLLNQLLSRRLESGHSLCCIQFEQGEQALEQDLIDRGNLDLLHFPVRKLQSGAGMQQVSKQIYDYLLRNDPEELWIEWNGTLPISVLQTLFPPAKKQDGGTPGDFCQLQRMLYLADSTKLDALLQQTGGMALEQISASDVIVLRNWGPVSQFKNRKRMLRELNPGVKVLPLNSVGTVERAMLRPGRQPAFWFLLGIAYFTAAYLTLRMVIGAGGNLADAVVNVFLGILLQAFPFLLIGVLLSSAIQIFVSQQWLHEHFPKHLAGGLLFAALAGFCLPVCDCASVPVFRSLVRKGVPPAAAVTFLMAAPVINPVVILSTWYAFSGDVRIVLCRVGLGLLCAVLIGLTFSRAGKNGLSPSGSGWFSCACGCSVGQAAEGGKLSLYGAPLELHGYNSRQQTITVSNEEFYDWLCVFYTDIEQLEGFQVTMTGQVYKNTPVMADNEFVPARLVMACCVADLSPCGLFCTYGNVSELESDSWVTVTGILYGEQYKGQEEPRLRVTSVVPAKPIEGYIFPYS